MGGGITNFNRPRAQCDPVTAHESSTSHYESARALSPPGFYSEQFVSDQQVSPFACEWSAPKIDCCRPLDKLEHSWSLCDSKLLTSTVQTPYDRQH